ncbi:MAG: septal ring lytic transglycosylase RlpA family protein [Deltaproteobacteria bacterium]|nr:septal ring lytic transglycosylase RlpA family protein [Deltaproteobacteria bacterium]
MKKLLIACLLLTALLPGCARETSYVRTTPPPHEKGLVLPQDKGREAPKPYDVNGNRYYPLPDAEGFVESGKASWYGPDFHGRPTSSGEIFDMHKKTAAHKTLPLSTVVKVTNLSNGKYTVVPINDRGPFVKGRIIDLSYAAAREIDLVGAGVADVRVVALGKEIGRLQEKEGLRPVLESQDFRTGEFTVQVGAFENKTNALLLAERLRILYKDVNITVYVDTRNKTFYRVQVSRSKTLDEAGVVERRLEALGFADAFIVRM